MKTITAGLLKRLAETKEEEEEEEKEEEEEEEEEEEDVKNRKFEE